MSSILRRLLALGATAAVMLLVGACGGHSKTSATPSTTPSATPSTTPTASSSTAKSGSTVIGRRTTVLLYPSMTATLKNEGVTVTPVPPSSGSKSVLSFPINGGHIVIATFVGALDHGGGLTLSHHGKNVTLTEFVINTHTKQLTAKMGGNSVPLFKLDLRSLKHASEPKRTMVATSIKLTVTSDAATTLNSGLGTTAFKGGQDFGVATMVIALK